MTEKTKKAGSDFSFISLFFILMSVVMAGLIWLSRLPFAEPSGLVLAKSVLLLGAVVFAWQETDHWARERKQSRAVPLLAVLGTMAMVYVVHLLAFLSIVATILFAGLWFVGLRRLIREAASWPLWLIGFGLIGPVVLAVLYFLVINTYGYAHVYTPEYGLLGLLHRDTLFHLSISSLMTKYGAVSVGLDGLVPLDYHVFSHGWLGALSRWLGVSVGLAYPLGVQVFGVPMLLFSFISLCYSLARARKMQTCAALLLAVPICFLLVFDMWDWFSYLVSESYLFSLVVFMLTLPLLFEFIDAKNERAQLARLALLMLVSFILFQTKLSVGVVLLAASLFAAVRVYGRHFFKLALLSLPVVAGVGYVGLLYSGQSLEGLFRPLHFVSTYPRAGWANILVALFMLGLLASRYLSASRQGKILYETIAVICALSFAPALLLYVAGGSAYYFLNIASWVAIAILSTLFILPLVEKLARPQTVLAGLVVIMLFAVYNTPQKSGSFLAFQKLITRLDESLAKASAQNQGPMQTQGGKVIAGLLSANPALVAQALARSGGGRIKSQLTKAGVLKTTNVLVFVPPDRTALWTYNKPCYNQPMFIPALFATPMINGLPPENMKCDPGVFSAYTAYGDSSRARNLSDEVLCEKAKTLDFDSVYILEGFDEGRLLRCP